MWNEVATIFLVVIITLATVKQTESFVWSLAGLIGFIIVLMSAIKLYKIVRTTKEKELTDLGNRIQDFQQTAQESIQKKKEELYGPILKKAEDAIKDIAKEKAYSYIFDTSLGSVIFAQESDNIMPLVKTRLGIK